jgi:hypothetical protein
MFMSENTSKTIATAIIELLQSMIEMYFEALTRRSLKDTSQLSEVVIRLLITLFIAGSVLTAAWFCILGLLFSYLQNLGLAQSAIWASLIGLNSLVLVALVVIFGRIKKQI